MKLCLLVIVSLINLLHTAQAQGGLSLSTHIPAGSWPTAPYAQPYPNAWITGGSATGGVSYASSGFNNAFYDTDTDRTYFSAPFSIGFTSGISGSVPTILVAWSNTPPLNNLIRIFKNATSPTEGYAVIVHDVEASIISLTSPFPTLVPPTSLPGALQITDAIYQEPYVIFTQQVSNGATTGTWYNTISGVSGTATLSSSRRCFVSFYHPTLNNLYWGCLGGFLWNSAANRPIDSGGSDSPTFVSAGAGNFTTGYLHTPQNILYLGSSIGLGISIDLTTNTINELFFTFGSNTLSHLTSVIMDTTGTLPVLFWGTSDGRVVRSNTRNFKTVFASASLQTPERLSSAFGNDGNLYFGYGYTPGASTNNANYHTWALTKSNCSSYSCSTCLGVQLIDKEYCGMCIDTGICSAQRDCPGSSWTQSGFCPSADSVSLAQNGSISGGTLSQFNGAYFKSDPGDLNFYKCGYFSGATEVNVSATALDVSYVQCQSPSWSTAGPVGVRVYYKNRIWAGDWTYTYYDCSSTTSCSNCGTSENAECGWCFETNKCASQAQCNQAADPFWRKGLCPIVRSMAPVNVSTADSSLRLTIPVSNFIAPPSGSTYSFTCTVNGFSPVTAGVVGTGASVTAITCPFDPASVAVGPSGQEFYTVSIGSSADASIVYGTTPDANLEVYHCPSLSICVDCRAPSHSRCAWCASGSCGFATSCTASTTACMSISDIDGGISRLSMVQAASHILTISGSNIITGPTGPQYCHFTNDGGQSWNSTLTFVDSMTVRCPMPNGLTKGEYSLALYRSAILTNSLPLELYRCGDRKTCDTCLSTALGDVCEWCATTASPGCIDSTQQPPSSCTNLLSTNSSLCPMIYEAAPNLISVLGAPNVTLLGPHRIPESEKDNAGCEIKRADYLGRTSLNWYNETAVVCNDIPDMTTGSAEISIVSKGTGAYITNSVEITFANCSEFTNCDQCMGSPYSFCVWCGATCTETCTPELSHVACPTFDYMTPNYSIQTGGDRVSIYGSNFLLSVKRASLYQCVWDASTRTEVTVEDTSTMSCLSPARSLLDVAPLSIEFGGKPYLRTTGVEVFSCVAPAATVCMPQCAERPHCGWCLATQSCGSEYQCDSIGSQWLSQICPFATLDSTTAPLEGNYPITALLSRPLPPDTVNSDVTCSFGPFTVASEVIQSGNFTAGTGTTHIKCLTPAVSEPITTNFGIQYRSQEYITPTPFKYVDCSIETDCTGCIAVDSCGWCTAGTHRCTFQGQCMGSNDKWKKDKCPINKVALGVGLGVGLFALLLLILLAIFLIRRARKRRGLLIELKEPNYADIAWGTDVILAWKVPEHEYKLLELGLSRRDFLLQLAIAFNCPATEQDAMAKALVFIAHKHGLAADMIQKCIRFEVQICKHENTLFRNNSVASKMYKFFSRIVGVKYLFHGIARVILELEILGRQQTAKARKGSSSGSNDVSLLSMSMELDQTKALDGDDLDTDTNLLQLQLICQKLLNVLVKTNLKEIPAPFRKIFIEIDNSIMAKFAGSNDAVYKGIGGLYFLRFVCPAITAPHVYGLLESPPNNVTQRQLVLISKVIQNIANMQPPGKKEAYMTALNDFIVQSIPKIIKFYDNLRMAVNVRATDEAEDQQLEVPDEVRLNSIAALWNFLYTAKPKIEAWVDSEDCPFEESEKASLKELLDECAAEYTSAPKKLRNSSAATAESGTKKKKKKKTA